MRDEKIQSNSTILYRTSGPRSPMVLEGKSAVNVKQRKQTRVRNNMVQFDELRISKDSRKLIVRAHINTLDYYEHLSISGLYINTDDDRPDFGVANTNKAVYKKEDFEEGTRQIELEIDCNETLLEKDFSQNLLFVFIKTKGTPSPCTPCGFNEEYSLGVTFDVAKLYNKAMGYIKELGDSCNISKNFIDFIL